MIILNRHELHMIIESNYAKVNKLAKPRPEFFWGLGTTVAQRFLAFLINIQLEGPSPATLWLIVRRVAINNRKTAHLCCSVGFITAKRRPCEQSELPDVSFNAAVTAFLIPKRRMIAIQLAFNTCHELECRFNACPELVSMWLRVLY